MFLCASAILDILIMCQKIVAYSARLFSENLGFAPMRAVLVSGIIQTCWAVFVLMSTTTIERFGRRPTLLVGTVLCSIG